MMNGAEEKTLAMKHNSQYKEIWRRFKKNKTAVLGLVILVVYLLVIVFADVIVDPELVHYQDYNAVLQRPAAGHIWGTDEYGRDIFARVIHGTRYSFSIAVSVVIAAELISLILGTISAYLGGVVDQVIMRIMDILSSIPQLLFAMCIVAVMGTSSFSLFVALTVTSIAYATRIARTGMLNVVDNEYVEACRACGTSTFRILVKHVLPNALSPVIVHATMAVSSVILDCASLSFIGLGFQEPTPEWGAMLSLARGRFYTHFYLMIAPTLAILFASLSINLVGDGLRDALDPKLRD